MAVSGDPASQGATPDVARVYHVELRQFPHNLCHFNMTAEQLNAAVVDAWARDRWIEMGDRKWSPHQAKLTIIESPNIPVGELSMGRGWRTAQREGRDVTERVLAAARERNAGGAQASPQPDSVPSAGCGDGDSARALPDRIADAEAPGAGLLADSLGLELLGHLRAEAVPLCSAWELAGTRYPGHAASECLALAERAVGSLLRSGLVVLVGPNAEGSDQRVLEAAEARKALLAADNWWSCRPPGIESPGGRLPGGVMLRKT